MKKTFLFMICALYFGRSFAQTAFEDSIAQSRNKLTQHAMVTLGSWALANIGTGFIVASETSGEPRYFWLMNSYWNFINLGLAVPGYLGAIRAASQRVGFAENVESQLSIEKLYILNAGLDLVYITGGFYLGEKGNTEKDLKKSQQLSGYGNSIIVQGVFLLLMDAVMYTLHHRNTHLLNNHLRRLNIAMGPGGMGMLYKF